MQENSDKQETRYNKAKAKKTCESKACFCAGES